MDYEKKYKEALQKIRELIEKGRENGWTIITYEKEFEEIFPELKASDDERIRKEMITAFSRLDEDSTLCRVAYNYKKWIAWLEKQGGITKLSKEEQNRFAKGVLTSCALSFIDYLDAHKYEGKMCLSNGECEDIENAFHNAMWDRLHRYYCKYIEKQGELKPSKWTEGDVVRHGGVLALVTNGRKAMKSNCEQITIQYPDEWVKAETKERKYFFEELEKQQGGQKPFDYEKANIQQKDWAEIPFGTKDSELQEVSYHIPEGFHAEIDDNRVVIKKGEQKPAWSKEDEEMRLTVLQDLQNIKDSYPNVNVETEFNWLKSLKDRYTWKLSDEQLEALKNAIHIKPFENPSDNPLWGLYEQLKKLIGE